jgi:hypothetical protein
MPAPRPADPPRRLRRDRGLGPASSCIRCPGPGPLRPRRPPHGFTDADSETAPSGLGDRLLPARRPAVGVAGRRASALGDDVIARSGDVGTATFDPRVRGCTLRFAAAGRDRFRDLQSGSTWDITGRAIAGPMRGAPASAPQRRAVLVRPRRLRAPREDPRGWALSEPSAPQAGLIKRDQGDMGADPQATRSSLVVASHLRLHRRRARTRRAETPQAPRRHLRGVRPAPAIAPVARQRASNAVSAPRAQRCPERAGAAAR